MSERLAERPADGAIETLVEELITSTGQLVRRLRAEANPSELTLSQAAVLARLRKGGPATIADLARAEGVKPQSMGATLAALDRDGLVERQPDPTDGRQAIFHLTDLGQTTLAQARRLKRQWLSSVMAELAPAEQQALTVAARVLRRLARA
jgi:DNA-binding MarR family transcriptional regulator